MNNSDIISIVAIVVSFISAIITLFYNLFSNKEERKRLTIEAFNKFQNDVLDKVINCSKSDVIEAVENKEDEIYKEIYNAYRVQTARCEHFATGINKKVFDYKMFCKLGGLHIMYLYEKLEPIIIEARSFGSREPYSEFEKLYIKLKNEQNPK